jgi:hypothetical protein
LFDNQSFLELFFLSFFLEKGIFRVLCFEFHVFLTSACGFACLSVFPVRA